MTNPFDGRSVQFPYSFLNETLPHIQSLTELHVSLAFFRMIAERGGDDTSISEIDIVRDGNLRSALRLSGGTSQPDDRIVQGLEQALGRGTLLRISATVNGRSVWWYFLNTAVNRAAVEAMQKGTIAPPAIMWKAGEQPVIQGDAPSVYRAYEQNIGPLTPFVADQIRIALADYPADWIEDAIEEAVAYNRRNWRYIQRILESWQERGRTGL